ncbi:MAG: hypothetical protein CSYNP_02684 [Syntrophus sp. SKADARSKE-3]|nr:hypothetical protein [Syntrophus sp. SKADARSKE-3]
MLEQTLIKMADTILHLDEASMVGLWEKYRKRMEQVDMSSEWQRSVVIFFIINAVRAKNQMFNEMVLQQKDMKPPTDIKPARKKPSLRLIKTDHE